MQTLLEKVKANLILEHHQDDELLQNLILTATAYAESYQKKEDGFYAKHDMHPTTEQAVIILSSHFYESRDGSTGGFFADNVQASNQVWTVVNRLLDMNKDFKV
ncbi:head-tail connector protein [uncultured Acetobacterium sp.]|uniref:head-tail connector protein n=1 Tax=uncultured Acetobacterium sp. TaxID=217139 RepID=UPI0025FB7BF9|nr:head-tail connector protein [uncultured Acetobacterium sp.]